MSNPFLGRPQTAVADDTVTVDRDALLGAHVVSHGPQQPPRRVPAGDLPLVNPGREADLWIYQLHGGAGSSTLQQLLRRDHGLDAHIVGGGWPHYPGEDLFPTLAIARTHGRGIEAAHHAMTQWGSGELPTTTRVMGLVLVSDGPKVVDRSELKALRAIAPAVWHIGWVDQWRTLTPESTEHQCSVRIRMTLSSIVRALQAATWVPPVASVTPERNHR